MDRKATTKFLTEVLLQDRLSDRKYYAKEVTLDYGTNHTKRVDIMQFAPKGVQYTSDIEKGMFICYEVKSCKQDVYSGNGLNFMGEKNYIVTTMETWKAIKEDFVDGKLSNYIKENYPESLHNYGILVPVPKHIDLRNTNALYNEYDKPTEIDYNPDNWRIWTAVNCHEGHRVRSMSELLFCMLRSKHSYTNSEMR